MLTVHPEFDPETLTWFVPGMRPEARTVRELRELLGGAKVQIVGWRPMGTRAPLQAPAPLTADRVLARSAAAKKVQRVRKHMAEARRKAVVEALAPAPIEAAPVEAPPVVEAALPAAAEPETAMPPIAPPPATAVTALHFAPFPPKRRRTAEWFRSRCTPEQNTALDLWAAGVPGPAISRQLGHHTNASVAAHWVPTARKRGDPRAVIRDRSNYGKPKRQPKRVRS